MIFTIIVVATVAVMASGKLAEESRPPRSERSPRPGILQIASCPRGSSRYHHALTSFTAKDFALHFTEEASSITNQLERCGKKLLKRID